MVTRTATRSGLNPRWISSAAALLLIGAVIPALAQDVDTIRKWARQGTRAVLPPDMPRLGALPSTDAEFASTSSFHMLKRGMPELPASVLLTDYLPPVGAQGAQGSCVGWSTAYYTFSYGVAKARKFEDEERAKPLWKFSPAFIYHLANKGEDQGMTVAQAMKILLEKGCASLAEMPYDDKDVKTQPSDAALERAAKFKVKTPKNVGHLFTNHPDLEALKRYLFDAKMPFVMSIPIYKDFPWGAKDPDFVYNVTVPTTRDNFYGLHAITIVGYDDARNAFRMVNSWGPGWGDKGFLWLSDDYVKNGAVEGWGFFPGGPGIRSMPPRNLVVEAPRG